MIQEDENNENGITLTPWFKLIVQKFIFSWWDQLKIVGSLKDNEIHRFL